MDQIPAVTSRNPERTKGMGGEKCHVVRRLFYLSEDLLIQLLLISYVYIVTARNAITVIIHN